MGVELQWCHTYVAVMMCAHNDLPTTRTHTHRLLRETFEPQLLTVASHLMPAGNATVVEVGPRMSFSTAFSTNAVSIAASCGLSKVSGCVYDAGTTCVQGWRAWGA